MINTVAQGVLGRNRSLSVDGLNISVSGTSSKKNFKLV